MRPRTPIIAEGGVGASLMAAYDSEGGKVPMNNVDRSISPDINGRRRIAKTL